MDFNPYYFPDLKKDTSSRSRPQPDRNPEFRPAFLNPDHGGRPTPSNERAPAFDQAREKGYGEGIAAGRREGTRLARKELAPEMDHFVAGHDDLAAQISQSAELTAERTMRLVRAFVERLLGSADLMSTEVDEQALRKRLAESLRDVFRLVLRINPDDLASLRALADQSGIRWPAACDGIVMESHPDHPGGTAGSQHHMDQAQTMIDDILNDLKSFFPPTPLSTI